MKTKFMKRGMVCGVVVQVVMSGSAGADYLWLGTSTGESVAEDVRVRRTVFNGDAVSLYAEANWENLGNPGTAPLANAINNSVQAPAGIDAPLRVLAGVAGGTNGAGPGSQFRTNGHAVTVTGPAGAIKIRDGMVQNDGVAGGARTVLTVAGGGFVTATQLQDVAATLEGRDSRLLLTASSAVHGCLENSTVNLLAAADGYPEVLWVNNTMENVLLTLPSVTLDGVAPVYGNDPFQVETGDNVVFTQRNGIAFNSSVPGASYRQLSGNAGAVTNGVILRVLDRQVTPRYWDINGSVPGAGGGDPEFPLDPTLPDGTWDAGTANWTDAEAGDAATSVWAEGAVASFAAGGEMTGSYLVKVSGSRSVGGLLVENGSLELSGGEVVFAAGAELYVGNSANLLLETPVSGLPDLRVEGSSVLTLLADQSFGGLCGTGLVDAGDWILTLDVGGESTYWGSIGAANKVIKKGAGELRLVRPQGGLNGEVEISGGKLTLAKIQGNSAHLDGAAVIRVKGGAVLDVTSKPSSVTSTQILTGSGTVLAADKTTYTGTSYANQVPVKNPGFSVLGTIEPGDGIGTLTIRTGTLAWVANSVLKMELDDASAAVHDRLVVDGALSIAAGAQMHVQVTGALDKPVYPLISYSGTPPTGTFTVSGLPDGYKLDHAYGGNTVALVKEVAAATYDTWAAAQGIEGAGFAVDGPDADGIPNGVEYALGYPPREGNARTALVASGGQFTLTLPKGAQAAADPQIAYAFEISEDLVVWQRVAPTRQDATSFTYVLEGTSRASYVRARIERTP